MRAQRIIVVTHVSGMIGPFIVFFVLHRRSCAYNSVQHVVKIVVIRFMTRNYGVLASNVELQEKGA